MRFFRFLFLVVSISILSFSALAQNLPSMEKISNKGKLVVALPKTDLPPMFSVDKEGRLVGHEIDLAHSIGKQLGVSVEFLRTAKTFDEVVDQVRDGKADIGISLLTPDLSRAKKVFFTVPYLYLKQVLVYNRLGAAKAKLTDPVNQMRTIPGLKIGVWGGSSNIEQAKRYYPEATFVSFPNLVSALPSIEKGELSGFFGDAINVYYWLKQDKNAQLYVGAGPIKNSIEPIAIAVSSKYPDLLTWLNLLIELRKLDHVDDQFKKEYSGSIGVK